MRAELGTNLSVTPIGISAKNKFLHRSLSPLLSPCRAPSPSLRSGSVSYPVVISISIFTVGGDLERS